jgi:hypothetical protein
MPPVDGIQPYGRVGINHAQPEVGIDYPLVAVPSDDVSQLLADLCLSYEDPSDYNSALTPFKLPFRISWLGGFGNDPATGSPSAPTNAADIIIRDANNAPVFDSRFASLIRNLAWGPRLWLYEWLGDIGHLTVIRHTAWREDDTQKTYSSAFNPVSAQLHARTVRRLARRVKTITAVMTTISQDDVDLAAEYNMVLAPQSTTNGLRDGTRITFDATPGGGLGVYPDCEDKLLAITKINGITPTQSGNFFLLADECYFARQPVQLLSEDPRRTYPSVLLYPYNEIDVDLPDPAAGTTTAAAGWPTEKEYAHLYLGNDCVPCCDCADYVDAAQFIIREASAFKALARKSQTAAKQYEDVRNRFIADKNCRTRFPLRVTLQPQACPTIDVVVQYCNQTDQCITDLRVNLELDAGDGVGAELPGYTQIKGARFGEPGNLNPLVERSKLNGTWPNYYMLWEYVPPYASVYFRTRFEFGECGGGEVAGQFEPYVVAAAITASVKGVTLKLPPLEGQGGNQPEIIATSYANAALRCPAANDDVAKKNFCLIDPTKPGSIGSMGPGSLWRAGATGPAGPAGATGVGSASFTFGPSPPPSPVYGAVWLDSNTGRKFIFTYDANSDQWIEI